MIKHTLLAISVLSLTGCGIFGGSKQPAPQPLPPVKVITETVQMEIYQPPLPQAIRMQDVTWHVITNAPCLPATGKDKKTGLYTTQKYQTEEYQDEQSGETKTRAVRDADGNRVMLSQLLDQNGKGIEVCGNLAEKIKDVEKELGGDFVVMAITPKGYENMAYNLQEIKRYLNQQKEIIMYYREATAADKSDEAEDWSEKNQSQQQKQLEKATSDNESQAQAESHRLLKQSQPQQPEKSGLDLSKFNPFN